jgi:hypothetical protein
MLAGKGAQMPNEGARKTGLSKMKPLRLPPRIG